MRDPLEPAEGSPPGEVALLSFRGEISEAQGVASLVQQMIEHDEVAPEDILILLRGDHNGTFSAPIKQALEALDIAFADSDAVDRLLAETVNRKMLATFRLLVNRRDSLAWATLLLLTPRVGETFCDYIYERARVGRTQFGQALFDADAADFPDGPRSSQMAREMMGLISEWLDAHPVPAEFPEHGWGHWMVEVSGGDIVSKPNDDFGSLLETLDGLIEDDQDLERYLAQISPLGKDHALAESQGVRIMTMIGSKGLTVRAAILAGLDEGIIPRPDHDLSEERRLLFVAMTRAKEFLFCTWAGRRRGPTARAGAPRHARNRRRHSHFFDGGPVRSQDGANYLRQRHEG